MRKQAKSKATKSKKTVQQRQSAENKVQQHLEVYHIGILCKVVPIVVSLKDQVGKVRTDCYQGDLKCLLVDLMMYFKTLSPGTVFPMWTREPCLLLMCLSALDAFFHTAQIATPTPTLPRARNVMLNENNL